MDMWYFARICAHARSWREFAKCRFAHFPSFFSVHVDTYAIRLFISADVGLLCKQVFLDLGKTNIGDLLALIIPQAVVAALNAGNFSW